MFFLKISKVVFHLTFSVAVPDMGIYSYVLIIAVDRLVLTFVSMSLCNSFL